MNCVMPQLAAAEYFWGRLVSGGFILMDDYAYIGYELQYRALKEFARRNGVSAVSLPTGQGIIVKQ